MPSRPSPRSALLAALLCGCAFLGGSSLEAAPQSAATKSPAKPAAKSNAASRANARLAKPRVVLRTNARAAAPAAPAPAAAQAQEQAAEAPKQLIVLADNFPLEADVESLKAAGVVRYKCFYQNDFDPDAMLTGVINPDKLVAWIKSKYGSNPSGWGMLDYEIPMDVNVDKGPGHPDYEKTVPSMVAALKRVKEEFPNVKWTYYGIPGLKSTLQTPNGPYSFCNAPADLQQKEIERQWTNYGPILRECDWIMPCIYDVHENALLDPAFAAGLSERDKAYKKARIKLCKDFFVKEGLPPVPVIPASNLYTVPGGNTTANRLIPIDEWASEQAAAVFEAGADGIAFWTAVDYYIKVATKPDLPVGHAQHNEQNRVRDAMLVSYLENQKPSQWGSLVLQNELFGDASKTLKAANHRFREMEKAHNSAVASAPTSK